MLENSARRDGFPSRYHIAKCLLYKQDSPNFGPDVMIQLDLDGHVCLYAPPLEYEPPSQA
jgi:hypothetical protein